MKFIFALSFLAFAISGCSSIKKKCEQTNWFEHGYSVAMTGKRLNGDHFVKQCEEAEAKIGYSDLDLGFKKGMGNYCKPKTVYQTGKAGKKFEPDLCDGSLLKKLMARYNAGIKVFCKPANAKVFGAKGNVYENVCPEDLEPKFLTSYRSGRIIYLNGMISDNKTQIRQIRRKLNSENREKRQLTKTIAKFRIKKIVTYESKMNVNTGQKVKERVIKDDPRSVRKKRQLDSKLTKVEQSIRANKAKIETLDNNNLEYGREVRALKVEVSS